MYGPATGTSLCWAVRNPGRARTRSGASAGAGNTPTSTENTMAFILWIIAVILVIAGIVQLFRSNILLGVVLIIVGLLVGPGGVSIFTK